MHFLGRSLYMALVIVNCNLCPNFFIKDAIRLHSILFLGNLKSIFITLQLYMAIAGNSSQGERCLRYLPSETWCMHQGKYLITSLMLIYVFVFSK